MRRRTHGRRQHTTLQRTQGVECHARDLRERDRLVEGVEVRRVDRGDEVAYEVEAEAVRDPLALPFPLRPFPLRPFPLRPFLLPIPYSLGRSRSCTGSPRTGGAGTPHGTACCIACTTHARARTHTHTYTHARAHACTHKQTQEYTHTLMPIALIESEHRPHGTACCADEVEARRRCVRSAPPAWAAQPRSRPPGAAAGFHLVVQHLAAFGLEVVEFGHERRRAICNANGNCSTHGVC
jgi:hypothetical protein